jgi:hypothetical protein
VRLAEHINVTNQDVKSRYLAGPIKKSFISEKETHFKFRKGNTFPTDFFEKELDIWLLNFLKGWEWLPATNYLRRF